MKSYINTHIYILHTHIMHVMKYSDIQYMYMRCIVICRDIREIFFVS